MNIRYFHGKFMTHEGYNIGKNEVQGYVIMSMN